MLPLFNWNANAEVSQQTWSVVLSYSRLSAKSLEVELLPFYKSFAEQISIAAKEAGEHIEQFTTESQNRFGRHIAIIAMDVIETQKRVTFIEEYIPLLTPPALEGLAQGIAFRLNEMESPQSEIVWQEWLREYLDLRLLGRPASLTTEEANPFADVGLGLTQSFPEFVDRLVHMPLASVFVYSIIQEMQTNQTWRAHPIAACRYLTHVLTSGDGSFIPSEVNDVYALLKQSVGTRPEFREFENVLFNKGWRP